MSKKIKVEKSKKSELEIDTLKVSDPRAEAMASMVQNSSAERVASRDEFVKENGFDPDELEIIAPDEGITPDEIAAGHLESTEIEEKDAEIIDKLDEQANNKIIEREGTQYIRLNVDGQDVEMPVDEAVNKLQTESSATQKFREAARLKKETEDLIAQQQRQPTPPDDLSPPAVDTLKSVNSALNKVYEGEVDEGSQLLTDSIREEVKQALKAQDPISIDALVDSRFNANTNFQNLKSSYDLFLESEEFKGITKDKILLERVDTLTEDLQRDPDFMSNNPTYLDIFNEAGRRTLKWVKSLSEITQTPQTDEVDIRLKRKRQQPKPPSSRMVRRGPKQEKEPATTQDVIKQMAANRGQTNF